MFGLKLEEVARMIEGEMDKLREEFERRLRDVKAPPSAKELADQALKELLDRADPKELLDRIFLSRGITLETLVRQEVEKHLGESDYEIPNKDEIMEQVVEKVADNVWDELSFDELYPIIGEKVVDKMQKEK